MNNSETPTGVTGKKEVKVTKAEDVDKLIDKFFDSFTVRGLIGEFKDKKDTEKSLGGDDEKGSDSVFDVSASGQKAFDRDEMKDGLSIKVGTAPIEKVEKKVKQLKEKKAAEKENGKTGKPSSGGSDRSSR